MASGFDEGQKNEERRWLENWARVGPLLDAERIERLQRMTAHEGRERTLAVLALWRPSDSDELGAELVEHQRWFIAAARAAGSR